MPAPLEGWGGPGIYRRRTLEENLERPAQNLNFNPDDVRGDDVIGRTRDLEENLRPTRDLNREIRGQYQELHRVSPELEATRTLGSG